MLTRFSHVIIDSMSLESVNFNFDTSHSYCNSDLELRDLKNGAF